MELRRKFIVYYVLSCALLFLHSAILAQSDTTLKKPPTFMGKMINNFRKDTTEVDLANELKRNDQAYKKYEGLIIRDIIVDRRPFGIPFSDKNKKFANKLTQLANYLHHLTKTEVIERNLFFKKNDSIRPFLMADNERFLRQLPYLQDAGFIVVPISPQSDSVDVIVVVKDVFSLGGAIGSLGLQQSQIQMRDDNFAGTGNAAILNALYDSKRKGNFALGGEYVRRNIGGSFIDGNIGYQSFFNSFPGPKEENVFYVNLLKPLVNRYMRLTYELDASYHSSSNRYVSDSLYHSDYRFRFSNIDTWVAYNLHANRFTNQQEGDKLRKLIGLRFISNQFQERPDKYATLYNWQYADLTGLLATVTFYRQNFFKTQFIYGFGRNEDIPVGLILSLTSGYTLKQNKSRSFIGFNYQRYQFNNRKNYIGYTLRAEGYLNKKSIEDINLLVAINYFDHLKAIGSKWKQRFFLNLDAAQQVNSILNEPLLLNSKFGLPEYGSNQIGGTLRATAKAESVFFSPWSLAAFRFAPFVFSYLSVFSPYASNTKIYTSIGGGIRTRNESFVFGTIELKGFYFPEKNFRNEKFSFEISTNVIFKYNTQFVQRPDFIQIN